MTISVENCWLVVFPEEMVVLNFFCAHTTAHSSALKLLAFLCLLFLSRVIFPFCLIYCTRQVIFWNLGKCYIGLLLLYIYIFDCNNRKEGKGVQICWHDEVNNKWAKILQSRSVYTICSTQSLLLYKLYNYVKSSLMPRHELESKNIQNCKGRTNGRKIPNFLLRSS